MLFKFQRSQRQKHKSKQPQAGLLRELVGLRRLELLTPRLSSVCSNQLSYRPSGFSLFQN